MSFKQIYFAGFAMLCVIFVYLLPPFQGPDEFNHWNNAINKFHRITEGGVYCGKDPWLNGYFQDERIRFKPHEKMAPGLYEKLNWDGKSCGPYPKLSYPSLAYFPTLVSKVLISGEEKLGRKAVDVYFLSRILSALATVLVLWRVVTLARHNRYELQGYFLLLTFLLCPIFIQQSVVVSGDLAINLAALAAMPLLLSRSELHFRDLIWIGLLSIVASTTKPVTIPILMCCFAAHGVLILRERGLGFNKAAICFGLAAILIPAYMIQQKYNGNPGGAPDWANPPDQIQFLKDNPKVGAEVLIKSTVAFFGFEKLSFGYGWIPVSFDSVDTSLRKVTRNVWIALMALGAMAELLYFAIRKEGEATWPTKTESSLNVLSLSALCVGALGTALAMYLYFTPVGHHSVEGLQGRYFFPFVMIGLVILTIEFRVAAQRLSLVAGYPIRFEQALLRSTFLNPALLVAKWGFALTVLFLAHSVAWDLLVRYW